MSDTSVRERVAAGAIGELFSQYSATPGVFDEMEDSPGRPRGHWRSFIGSLAQLGRHELASRWENGRRIIREHGVTYNVYGDPQGMDRPWGLDLVPLMISPEDWRRIESGLIQRSRLLNLIMADIYSGSQRLLRHGFIPPELIYANPGFLRACRGFSVPGQVYLHFHACDLGRSADGQWWVLSDRTQAPSGAGYALENRTVISRILPDEIRESGVRRLGGFFRAQQNMLYRLAPKPRGNPSVVLLTPGPYNATYFEHAFLARHLGFPLVEGADLTVRDRRVFLKTLEGLQQVDVILRRVDDSYCDPLELRGESFLGVPGLVEAARAGNVAVANALGSGLLESPAFLAFLPALCRHLLDEELILPTVATWWCGQGSELRHVTEEMETLVIKPAFGAPVRQPWFGGRMSGGERRQLLETIAAEPRNFVGQERVILSRAPVWAEDRFEARSIVVRAYVANGGEDWIRVMPGGLTRVSQTEEDPVVSMATGGGSKDTWVLAESEEAATQEESAGAAELRPAGSALSGVPSRVADNLYWLGRYTERLEQTLRILRCVIGRLSGETGADGVEEYSALGDYVLTLEGGGWGGGGEWTRSRLQNEVLQRVYKVELVGSVRELLGRIRYIASTVRDRFSGDTWRILGRLELDARTRPGRLPLSNALTLIHHLVLDLAAFNGMEMENMTRGHGWRFLDLGRRLERASCVCQLMLSAARHSDRRRGEALERLLEIADSVMTYRRRYFAEARLPGVVELLMSDESNPRSFAFQLERILEHGEELPVDPAWGGSRVESGSLAKLLAELRRFGAIGAAASFGDQLETFLNQCLVELGGFSDDVTSRYFSHTAPRVG